MIEKRKSDQGELQAQDPVASAETPCNLDTLVTSRQAEIGGPKGPEPTRYGDWERRGRCIDF